MKRKVRAMLEERPILVSSYLCSSHFNLISFLSNLLIDLDTFAKLGMNLLKKLILPKNYCTFFLFLGILKLWMASTLVGPIFTPSIETIWPNSLPSCIAR